MFRGFIVQGYGDFRRDRLYFIGRLEDGRSFAVMESRWRPSVYIPQEALSRKDRLFSSLPYETFPASLEAFEGPGRGTYACLKFPRYQDRALALGILKQAGIPTPYGDMKLPDMFLAERYIKGPVEIRGAFRSGRVVDQVFPNPGLSPQDSPLRVALTIASVDIETHADDGSILAIAIALTDAGFKEPRGLVRVRSSGESPRTGSAETVLFHPDEGSMLRAFIEDIRRADPDVLTGWNVLDFDFKYLWARCARQGIPFCLGRSGDVEAVYFSGEGRLSAAALVPGRQVIDALRIVRSGPPVSGRPFADYTLETVSQAVLGEGKLAGIEGTDKIAALARLYARDPVRFGAYCYHDAVLVLRILGKTGLFRLTLERSCLTGVSLDKAWTSVVSFERVYGMELRKKGIAPDLFRDQEVSGAAGGTVLDPLPGFFRNVAVFDFRSLYPTIIRTFNVDPLSHARVPADSPQGVITAPNGVAFSRTAGVLPALIAGYFAARRKALGAGDDTAAHVYKILMNSFYGVLGTGACRYARTELAGAITSFARKWLLVSRDWFAGKGCRVLYGDTDSLFVEIGLSDSAAYGDFASLCGNMAGELNRFLTERILEEYRLESFLEMRFEKAYRRFLIPPLRALHESGETARGRAKGYSGLLLAEDGTVEVEVKGMEAVRSDVTPLARRVQLELLELVFSDAGEEALRQKVSGILKELRGGKLDGELVYRKRLSRPPETYTASTPPQVKAARALGWKGRRGTVEFVWTVNGPEPASLPHARFDYDHYTDSQVLPVARSIAAALRWHREFFPQKGRNREDLENGQMELEM
ncbi:MAG: DNA polymerase II [Treponema sp.]|nr:DNA polymerase II [Treponema sp.]